jgi:hypothetical protein
MYPTDKFIYTYLAGPVDTPEEIDAGVTEGNCRFALQLYFYRKHGIFFQKDDIYLPDGYNTTGKFIFKEEPIDFDKLLPGDVVYAQNLRSKEGDEIDKSMEKYASKEEWIFYFHSAIFIGQIDDKTDTQYIWHATYIEGGPTLWTLEKFMHYYKPISAKRVL